MNVVKLLLLVFPTCLMSCNSLQSSNEPIVDSIVDEFVENGEDGRPQVATNIHSLDDEWFQTHAATHRFILKPDKKLYEIEDLYDASSIKEGSYSGSTMNR